MTTTAIPATPPAASSSGLHHQPRLLPAEWRRGRPVDHHAERPLRGRADVHSRRLLGSGQYVVADPMPAGFEIENPDLLAGLGRRRSQLARRWIAPSACGGADRPVRRGVPLHLGYFERDDRLHGLAPSRPGSFVMPGATVEDMYRPELRGNTDAGHDRGHAVRAMSTGDTQMKARRARVPGLFTAAAGVWSAFVGADGSSSTASPCCATIRADAAARCRWWRRCRCRRWWWIRPGCCSGRSPPMAGAGGLPVEIGEVDQRFIDMLLAYEDAAFCRRTTASTGVSMLRAAAQYVGAGGHIVSGGSTLTMQVARLLEQRADAQPCRQAPPDGACRPARAAAEQGRDPDALPDAGALWRQYRGRARGEPCLFRQGAGAADHGRSGAAGGAAAIARGAAAGPRSRRRRWAARNLVLDRMVHARA